MAHLKESCWSSSKYNRWATSVKQDCFFFSTQGAFNTGEGTPLLFPNSEKKQNSIKLLNHIDIRKNILHLNFSKYGSFSEEPQNITNIFNGQSDIIYTLSL